MKRNLIITIFISLFLALFLYTSLSSVDPEASRVEFNWVAFDDAVRESSQTGRLILVDIYEVGCKFCRAMENEVYPSAPILAMIERHFIPVRIDGRSEREMVWQGETILEKDFAQRMGVTAYPYTIVLDAEGAVLERQRGFMDILSFRQFLRSAVETSQGGVSGASI